MAPTPLLKHPWDFTAEEFLGPRIRTRPMNKAQSAELLATVITKRSVVGGVKEEVEEFEVVYSKAGVTIYDGVDVVGVLGSNNIWSVKPEIKSTGIVSRITSEYRKRYGIDPRTFIKERLHTLTPDGEKLVRRVHSLCVEDAVRRGLKVEKRVLRSVSSAKASYAILRAGADDSVLARCSDAERRQKRIKTRCRYRWVEMTSATMQWLREGCGRSLDLKLFESLVVET